MSSSTKTEEEKPQRGEVRRAERAVTEALSEVLDGFDGTPPEVINDGHCDLFAVVARKKATARGASLALVNGPGHTFLEGQGPLEGRYYDAERPGPNGVPRPRDLPFYKRQKEGASTLAPRAWAAYGWIKQKGPEGKETYVSARRAGLSAKEYAQTIQKNVIGEDVGERGSTGKQVKPRRKVSSGKDDKGMGR